MTEPEELDEDLFADLYDADEPTPAAAPPAQPAPESELAEPTSLATDAPPLYENGQDGNPDSSTYMTDQNQNAFTDGQEDKDNSKWDNDGRGSRMDVVVEQDSGGIGIKEDGKMFIGGLNWETTDQSLKDYFSEYGEVQECTVMRDGATGRSRGFGFLTFRDPKTVNVVMIDPKRAIPRDEQERTSKIFVGGVSQDATEADFKEYFMQYGRVVDATLMMDKDTGRPRGFGFVTFDSEAAVDATFQGDLMIHGKPIEVKKAQPRGNMRDDDDSYGRRGGRRGGKDFRDDRSNYDNNSNGNQNQNQPQQNGQGTFAAGMTPQMMAQAWTKIQQYMAMMQQQAASQMSGGMGMAGMNPAMMQQMAQMQQMKQLQQMAARQQGSQSPMPQSPGAQGMPAMNPAMMQQMQQMQQMQSQMQGGGGFGGGMAPPMPSNTPGPGFGGRRGTPGYNAQDQLAFEQQKYEQQQARRAAQEQHNMQYQHGGPTSWEGMYDDVPQPNMGQHGGMGRGGRGGRGGGGHNHGQQQQPQANPSPQSAPPANAPTGPKNAGKPGANYRGGGHRGAHRGFHPYSRN
ncbi:MAG: hypothetical protein LQ350_007361 [Teloschistes chrysophthalmus]|nr:MAG: hypothetical protein LQ350_007361 [Niorma chrysophthalma]